LLYAERYLIQYFLPVGSAAHEFFHFFDKPNPEAVGDEYA